MASPGAPYTLKVIQSMNEVDRYGAQIVVEWNAAYVIIDCTITHMNLPNLPTETQYLINSGDLVIDIAPSFTQYPAC